MSKSGSLTTYNSKEKVSPKVDIQHYDNQVDDSRSYRPRSVRSYGNMWRRLRRNLREPFAEFLGTMIILLFGAGVDCQVVLSGSTAVASSQSGSYLSINFGWGAGTALGVWVSGGISGGHLNPGVTLALAAFRGFPWKKVPVFIFAQVLGAFCGAAIVYGNYWHAIELFEGGPMRTQATGGLFTTFAAGYMTNVSCFFDEFLGSAILMLVVLAINDRKGIPPPSGLAPLVLFITVLGLGISFGMQTGYAINPARDLGPRIFLATAGYGKHLWNFRNQYWIWCPILGPILGMQVATIVYDTFLYTDESPITNFCVLKETPLELPPKDSSDVAESV